jgi:hypothetical protein
MSRKLQSIRPFIVAATLLAAAVTSQADSGPTSQWVHPGPDGKLVYKTTPAGDTVMDFSFAGYMGGGVAFPSPPVIQTVSPVSGDASTVIQQAIDTVSKAPLIDGLRGVVLLKNGDYDCNQSLKIESSGVILRGSGNTTIKTTGTPHAAITVNANVKIKAEDPISITDPYLPSGSKTLHVKNANGLSAGDTIQIGRPATKAWVHFMGMDTLVRNDKNEHWVSGIINSQRKIAAITTDKITLDIPLADSFDSRYLNPPGSTIAKCTITGGISQVGIENLNIVSPPQSVTITEASNSGIKINGLTDGWVNNVQIENTVGAVNIGSTATRITVQNIETRHTTPTKGAAKPADFTAEGTQILYNHCTGNGDNLFYFATLSRVTGPIVLLNCEFHGNGHIQPHERWSTGLLVDNCKVPDSGIDFMNRGIMGSGHGWTIGWAVAWNCTAKTFTIEQPPGTMNWAIGCRGKIETEPTPGGNSTTNLPLGTVDSPNQPVIPASLYLQQLKDRLGPDALHKIGY